MKYAKPKYFDIPVFENISLINLTDLLNGLDYPLIIRNYHTLNNWEIFDWSLEKIANEFGDVEIAPRVNFPHPDNCEINLFTLTAQNYPKKEKMQIKDFIRLINKADIFQSPAYLQPGEDSKKIIEKINKDAKAFDFQNIIPNNKEESSTPPNLNLWIGSTGTRAAFHQDDRDNIIVIIEGKKSVHLCAPYYTSCLYPFYGLPDKSKVRPENFEPKKFPKMSEATFLKGMLEKGDLLYLPRGWWHTFRAYAPTMMLNYWFGEPLTKSDFKFMYKSLGIKYILGVKIMFVWLFLKTLWNLIINREPLHGLSVWYSPGTQKAINVYNAIKIAFLNFSKKIFRKNENKFTPVQRPFYYN